MNEAKVYIIDNDKYARESSSALMVEMGYEALCFSTAEEFIDAYRPTGPHCVLSDLRMPGLSGMELLALFTSQGASMPLVVLTAYADTELTVRSMRAGASAVLDKPCRDQDLWEAVREAVRLDARRRELESRRAMIRERIGRLTAEERQVLALIVEGKANKVIAQELLMGLRTVEVRRHHVFRKMKAGSLAELMRMVFELESAPPLTAGSVTRNQIGRAHSLSPPHYLTHSDTRVVS